MKWGRHLGPWGNNTQLLYTATGTDMFSTLSSYNSSIHSTAINR
jgi:hypothetical protein